MLKIFFKVNMYFINIIMNKYELKIKVSQGDISN